MDAIRTPVSLTPEERDRIKAAADRHGIRTLADFMRFSALYVARKGEGMTLDTCNDD